MIYILITLLLDTNTSCQLITALCPEGTHYGKPNVAKINEHSMAIQLSFNGNSMNIQWQFNEVNIQWQFNDHSMAIQ